MNELLNFVKENYISIATIVVIVLLLLVVMKIKDIDIDLNPSKLDSKLVQQVTVETLDMMNDDYLNEVMTTNPANNFCESYLGNSFELEKACNNLTKGNCAQTKCCVYAAEKCVAGDRDGPTYKKDKDGNLITLDSYYYLGSAYSM